jgi:hypothetical protein
VVFIESVKVTLSEYRIISYIFDLYYVFDLYINHRKLKITLSLDMSPGSANCIHMSCSLGATLVTFQLRMVLFPGLARFSRTCSSRIVSFMIEVLVILSEYLRVKRP